MYNQPKPRPRVELDMNMMDIIILMAEGNPGAITAMTGIINRDPVNGFMNILDFDDMNMRGEQIWVAYKNHCGGDMTKLIKCLQDRSKEMVATVNELCLERHRAVTSGASNPNFIR